MKDEVEYGIWALAVMSAVMTAFWAVGVLVQSHAEGSELLSWNSWLEYFSSWSG
jgi:hypothetical protein